MKSVIAIIFLTLSAIAQENGNFLGVNVGGSYPVVPHKAHPPEYRVVNGKIYDVTQLYDTISGRKWPQGWSWFGNGNPGAEVFRVESDGVICNVTFYGSHNQYVFVKNLPMKTGGYAENQMIQFTAMRCGTTNTSSGVLEFWDCGIPTNRPPDEEIAAAKAQAAVEEKKRQKSKEKNYQAQANAIRFLQPQATNGDASAQCELGLHYLNGQGCETNQEQGIYWLQKAAAQGDLRASKKLEQLKQQN